MTLDYSTPLFKNDTYFGDYSHMKVVRYNRTHKLWAGNVTYFVDVDDSIQVRYVR